MIIYHMCMIFGLKFFTLAKVFELIMSSYKSFTEQHFQFSDIGIIISYMFENLQMILEFACKISKG